MVSFKLETDLQTLIVKSRVALIAYGHRLVIANELKSRTERAILVDRAQFKEIILKEQNPSVKGIEVVIVDELVQRHDKFLIESNYLHLNRTPEIQLIKLFILNLF